MIKKIKSTRLVRAINRSGVYSVSFYVLLHSSILIVYLSKPFSHFCAPLVVNLYVLLLLTHLVPAPHRRPSSLGLARTQIRPKLL